LGFQDLASWIGRGIERWMVEDAVGERPIGWLGERMLDLGDFDLAF
jgi:hypothetical protein